MIIIIIMMIIITIIIYGVIIIIIIIVLYIYIYISTYVYIHKQRGRQSCKTPGSRSSPSPRPHVAGYILYHIIGGPGSAKVTGEIFEKFVLLKYVQELKMHCVLGNLLLTIWGIMALFIAICHIILQLSKKVILYYCSYIPYTIVTLYHMYYHSIAFKRYHIV